jgi:hypothetical protein
MDYIKNIISNYIYKNNKLDYEFSKPSAYKNINTSSVVKK